MIQERFALLLIKQKNYNKRFGEREFEYFGDSDVVNKLFIYFLLLLAGSINNIDDGAVKCQDGKSPEIHNKVISGVVGAASSVTSIQVANLLRLFKIPQVSKIFYFFQ